MPSDRAPWSALVVRHWRPIVFCLVLLAYALVTLGVAFQSPILRLDTDVVKLDLRGAFPQWRPWVKAFVVLGQRGPATLLFLPYFLWTAWRTRSTRPLVALGTGLVLLNGSVGLVKVLVGRLGPLRTHQVHDVFAGGNIYPSGHVSNSVVLYGLVAWISLRHRKPAAVAAAVLSVAIGLGTVYLDTHWFSDVLGGWLAGSLVLLALPTALPVAQRLTDRITDGLAARWRRRAGSATASDAAAGRPHRRPQGRPAGRLPGHVSRVPVGPVIVRAVPRAEPAVSAPRRLPPA